MDTIIEFAPGNMGSTANSKVVAPVLGTANNVPMVNIIIEQSILPKFDDILLVKSSVLPPTKATAIIPSIGRPIHVVKNPSPVMAHLSPEIKPSVGGKIKLPAPKNVENKANPVINIFFKSLLIFFSFVRIKKVFILKGMNTLFYRKTTQYASSFFLFVIINESIKYIFHIFMF